MSGPFFYLFFAVWFQKAGRVVVARDERGREVFDVSRHHQRSSTSFPGAQQDDCMDVVHGLVGRCYKNGMVAALVKSRSLLMKKIISIAAVTLSFAFLCPTPASAQWDYGQDSTWNMIESRMDARRTSARIRARQGKRKTRVAKRSHRARRTQSTRRSRRASRSRG